MPSMMNIFNKNKVATLFLAALLAMFVMPISAQAQTVPANSSTQADDSKKIVVEDEKTDFQKDVEERKNTEVTKTLMEKKNEVGRNIGAGIGSGFDFISNSGDQLSGMSLEIINAGKERGGVIGAVMVKFGQDTYLLAEGAQVVAKGTKFVTSLATSATGKVLQLYGDAQKDAAKHMRKLSAAVGDNFLGNAIGALASWTDLKGRAASETGEFFREMGRGIAAGKKKTNEVCKIEDMQLKYMSNCYSCLVVKMLLETFMNACAKVYDLCKEAGVILLMLGTMLGLAMTALKNVSSFSSVEPADSVNQLLIFLFKVLTAYVIISVGIPPMMNLAVNPLLAAGADFGLAIMEAGGMAIDAIPKREIGGEVTSYAFEGSQVVSPTVLNKILSLNQALDQYTSLNLLLGHALTCHAVNAGEISFADAGVSLSIPDIWIWFCGVVIWFFGFMLTLGISFYLLDVSFKVGFCIMMLPIAIALWPFSLTKDKITKVFSIVYQSAGTFLFLAVTTTFGTLLISEAFNDVDTLVQKIKDNDAEWVSDTFALFGSSFIIIVFCYLYAMKLISSTVGDYASKFFKDETFGSQSPMHKRATGAVSEATNAAKMVGGWGKDVVKHQGGKVAGKAWKGITSKFSKNKDIKAGKKEQKEGRKLQGKGAKNEARGKQLSALGDKLNKTKFGAIAGVALKAAGGAMQAKGKVQQAAGQAKVAAGKAKEQAARSAKTAQKSQKQTAEKKSNEGNK
jgi:hypothetical protein